MLFANLIQAEQITEGNKNLSIQGNNNTVVLSHKKGKDSYKRVQVRADFIIPSERVLLSRSAIMKQISSKLQKQKKLKKIVLIGNAGAGKTTLARRYAQSSDSNIVWELHATSKDALIDSMFDFAFALSASLKEKDEVKFHRKEYELSKKGNKIFNFIKKKLQETSDWILIFDDLASLEEVKKYIPFDQKSWGEGAILITTKNKDIKNAAYFSEDVFIEIGEITEKEKYILFSKINNNTILVNLEITEKKIKNFLKKIPPFPLDISIASYLIKYNPLKWDDYQNRLIVEPDNTYDKNHIGNFINYNKTRGDLVLISLESIIKINKKFEELICAICILDAVDIPLEMLYLWKPKELVDQFIFHLDRQFLGSYRFIKRGEITLGLFSFHHSVHEQIKERFVINKNVQRRFFESVTKSFIENSNNWGFTDKFKKFGSYMYLNQLSKVLEVPFIKKNKSYYLTKRKIGTIYKLFRMYDLAELHLIDSLNYFQKKENFKEIIKNLCALSTLYSFKGDLPNTERYLKKSINLYREKKIDDSDMFCEICIYYGRLLYNQGDTDGAREFYKKVFNKSQKNKNLYHIAKLYDAFISLQEGEGESVIDTINESLSFYKNDLYRAANARAHLAWAFLNKGDLERAENLCKGALEVYIRLFNKSHLGIAWIKSILAKVLTEKKEFIEAEKLFLESLRYYKKYFNNFSEYDNEMAFLYADFSYLYKKWGKMDKEKKYKNIAARIFDLPKNRHKKIE